MDTGRRRRRWRSEAAGGFTGVDAEDEDLASFSDSSEWNRSVAMLDFKRNQQEASLPDAAV